MKKYSFWLFVIIIIYSAWAVTSVSAHALLLRSNPEANATLAQPPVQVELFFSESLQPGISSIKVYDSNGLKVDVGDVRVDPADSTRMTVSLRALVNGVYTVTWKVVSSIDGHLTTGAFPFAVGDVNDSNLPSVPQSTSFNLPASELITKWLLLFSLALLTGQTPFIAFVWNPALKSNENEFLSDVRELSAWSTLYQIGLIGILLAFGLGILAQAGQSTGSELVVPWKPEAGIILTQTRLGIIWLIRFTLTLILVWLKKSQRTEWKHWAGFITSLALLLTISLTSHAATEKYPFLPVINDWLHLIGMTFWFGGLAYLFTGLRQFGGLEGKLRTRLTSSLMIRFSVMALASVGLIGLTGIYSAYLRVGSLPGLFTSVYGHTLLIKQIFVASLLTIAALNLLMISPQLKRDHIQNISNIPLVTRFGKMILVEMTLAIMLLAAVSVLTYLPPARTVIPNSDLTASANVDDLEIYISISPGRIGQNTFVLHLLSNGQHLQSVKEALLRFTPDQANIPPSELELIGQGDGSFIAKGTYLSLPGNWKVQAIIRRQDKFDAYADFNFTLNNPNSVNKSATLQLYAGGIILLDGLLCALLMFSLGGKPSLRFAVGALPTLLIMGLGVYYLTHPISVGNEQANPIPLNNESITAGETLFITNCVPCHGESGKGDGAVGLTLNPRPADLTLHAIPGVHTDAQLFEWIKNGFPGSSMPAFKSTLSDTDLWNLVNFIRTLAPK